MTNVTIEAEPGTAQFTGMTEAERIQMTRQHVFCINGSSTFLEFVRMLLEEECYNVTTTNFLPETFVQIAAVKPDLLILDLQVGKQACWDLLDRVSQDALTRDIPVIVCSTNQTLLDRARDDGRANYPTRYIVKPFDIDEMLSSVHELIGVA
jgi:twitching motility two-component system response regulator PilH